MIDVHLYSVCVFIYCITHLSKFLVCLTKHEHMTEWTFVVAQDVVPTTSFEYHCMITSLVSLHLRVGAWLTHQFEVAYPFQLMHPLCKTLGGAYFMGQEKFLSSPGGTWFREGRGVQEKGSGVLGSVLFLSHVALQFERQIAECIIICV